MKLITIQTVLLSNGYNLSPIQLQKIEEAACHSVKGFLIKSIGEKLPSEITLAFPTDYMDYNITKLCMIADSVLEGGEPVGLKLAKLAEPKPQKKLENPYEFLRDDKFDGYMTLTAFLSKHQMDDLFYRNGYDLGQITRVLNQLPDCKSIKLTATQKRRLGGLGYVFDEEFLLHALKD